MNKVTLVVIKLIITFVIIMLLVITKESLGLPAIVHGIIVFAVIIPLWKYQPDSTKDNNKNI